MVGVAVNVTLVPEQMVVADADTATEGVTTGLTVIVIVEDVAVDGDAQVAVDVITQETVFPFARDALVYVGLFVPTFAPLSFH
ncbi:hypothetical protein SDC9_106041 [bioreactor metagenome]|uniref:Uncharacterized protein n=1 Tax=bioreactor metagenome TaxID=1076179 RepID=A0A645B3Q3_9ZZZZ